VKVVHLGEARDLLAKWEDVRKAILKGNVGSFCITIRDHWGKDSIYMAGHFDKDPAAALKASLRMSWEVTKLEDRLDGTKP
jgi:hypothetical protein